MKIVTILDVQKVFPGGKQYFQIKYLDGETIETAIVVEQLVVSIGERAILVSDENLKYLGYSRIALPERYFNKE